MSSCYLHSFLLYLVCDLGSKARNFTPPVAIFRQGLSFRKVDIISNAKRRQGRRYSTYRLPQSTVPARISVQRVHTIRMHSENCPLLLIMVREEAADPIVDPTVDPSSHHDHNFTKPPHLRNK